MPSGTPDNKKLATKLAPFILPPISATRRLPQARLLSSNRANRQHCSNPLRKLLRLASNNLPILARYKEVLMRVPHCRRETEQSRESNSRARSNPGMPLTLGKE